MKSEPPKNFKEIVAASTNERDRVRKLVNQGKWFQAETDDARKNRFIIKNNL